MQNNLFLYIAIGVGAIIILLVLVFFGILPGLQEQSPDPASLVFWGFEDDEGVWGPIIQAFREKNRYTTIDYRRFDEAAFEDMLINRLAENTGPDIFLLKNSWVRKHQDKIYPLPKEALQFSTLNFKQSFVDGPASDLITRDGAILGLPLFIDSLALFYNKDIFNAEGIAEPPGSWDETVVVAERLTKRTPSGDIARSGLALGTARNVEHSFEVVSAFALQQGGLSVDPQSGELLVDSGIDEAFAFYTSFADSTKRNYMWNDRMPNSLDAFAEGKAAMVLGFSRDLKRLREKNSHLNIGIIPLPQLKDTRVPVTYGDYYFPTVSKFSQFPAAAWQFILFATGREGAALYLTKTDRPPALRALVSLGAPRDELHTFYRQALIAKGWRIPEERPSRNVFREAIDSIVSGGVNASNAVGILRQRLQLLIPRR